MYEKLSPFASIYLLTAVVAVLTAGALPSQIVLQAPGDDYDESILLTRTRQLTFAGLRAGEGYFSPDGNNTRGVQVDCQQDQQGIQDRRLLYNGNRATRSTRSTTSI